jgi:hypothetical protein
MAENFIDYVKIHCKSGLGGPGSSHFRREKFVEKGGPDGGDGGRGGHVILRGNKQLWTLLHLKYRKHVMAEDGMRGDKALRSGKAGDDQILDVPLGTVARDFETGEIIGEINEDGEELIVKKGGRGGHGNDFFKTPTNQAPTHAQPGEPNEEGWIVIELKLIGRCRFGRFSKCRKINIAVCCFGSKTGDSRLCLHYYYAKFGHGGIQRSPIVCNGRYSRALLKGRISERLRRSILETYRTQCLLTFSYCGRCR